MSGTLTDSLTALCCNSCGFLGLPPEYACPACGSDSLAEQSLSGKGSIYTYTIVQMGFGRMASRAPYVLAVVELAEGPRLTTIIEDLKGEDAKIGLPVHFSRHEEGAGPIFAKD